MQARTCKIKSRREREEVEEEDDGGDATEKEQ